MLKGDEVYILTDKELAEIWRLVHFLATTAHVFKGRALNTELEERGLLQTYQGLMNVKTRGM